MLSIIIEKEDFEVNCLFKTTWDLYPGIGYIGGGGGGGGGEGETTQIFPHLFFLLNIPKQHTESIIYMLSLRMKKRGIFSIEKKYGAFNRGTPLCFFKKHFTFNIYKKKKDYFFFTIFNTFVFLKYKYAIMCNYLNKYTNSNDAHYIRYTSFLKMYKKCIPYLSGIFSKLCSNKKKSRYGFKAYPCLNGQCMLPY